MARHVIVGLLDEPLPLALICPAEGEPGGLPVPPLEVIRYRPARLPFLQGRRLDALAGRINPAEVGLLHALDGGALPLTRQLAARLDVDYVAGVYSLTTGLRLDARCRALLAASEPIRHALLESRAGPEEMIPLHRPGVLQARRATCFTDRGRAAAIVAAGALDRHEPFAAVLTALARLRESGRECAFFLVGSGRAEGGLRRLAGRLSLTADLTFVGPQDAEQLVPIVRAADIFISPVPSDRLEIELLTAMAGGVPTLTAGAEAADFVINDKTALVFGPGDSAELAVKLTILLDDRVAARDLAENALAHLREHHSPARMIERLAELYRGIVGRSKRTD